MPTLPIPNTTTFALRADHLVARQASLGLEFVQRVRQRAYICLDMPLSGEATRKLIAREAQSPTASLVAAMRD